MSTTPADHSQNEPAPKSALTLGPIPMSWLFVALGVPVVGALCLLAFCAASPKTFWSSLAIGGGIALGAATVGGLLGFLFGIPRTLQKEGSERARNATSFRPNTNLEEISDWLTKILVGVGLIQLGKLLPLAQQLVASAGRGLGGDTAATQTLAAGLLAAFSVWGFLTVYLLTRTMMPRFLLSSEIDEIATQAAIQATSAVSQKIDDQALADAEALTLIEMMLDPRPNNPLPSFEDLVTALQKASPPILVNAFSQAAGNRRNSLRAGDKSKMELSIPIFKALIECDKEGKFHRNHGQLGYALKDKTSPELEAALDALNVAIRRRGPEVGYLLYEFNRVYCTVMLNQAEPVGASVREAIVSDLKVLSAAPKLLRTLESIDVVSRWLTANSIRPEEYRRLLR